MVGEREADKLTSVSERESLDCWKGEATEVKYWLGTV